METFTLDDVAKKSTETSGYIVIDRKVYEITDFLLQHPGGDDILRDVLGTDATEAFREVGHSEEAKEQLKPLLVGELEARSVATKSGAAMKASSMYVWLVPVFGIGLLSILVMFFPIL